MSSNFPSGTVTFLFTEIEGSTKLWEQHPQQMSVAHARHNQILSEAIESSHGYVFQVTGDAFVRHFILPEMQFAPRSSAKWIYNPRSGMVRRSAYEWAFIPGRLSFGSTTDLILGI